MLQKKQTNKYNRRKEKEIVSFQKEHKKNENLDFIHTKTIFFPYVQIETEEEGTYIKKEKAKGRRKKKIN